MAGDTLVLAPTQMELSMLQEFVSPAALDTCKLAVCGFGPIASAVETSSILATSSVERVVLIGIAGSYDLKRFPIGSVCSDFTDVSCDGIGAGTAEDLLLPSDLEMPVCQVNGQDVFETISLGPGLPEDSPKHTLLTVCRSAGSQADVSARLGRFPNAVAEDMEGFSVALAAARRDTSITIIRGLSNQAGDREKANWRIRLAMQAAAQRLIEVLAKDA